MRLLQVSDRQIEHSCQIHRGHMPWHCAQHGLKPVAAFVVALFSERQHGVRVAEQMTGRRNGARLAKFPTRLDEILLSNQRDRAAQYRVQRAGRKRLCDAVRGNRLNCLLLTSEQIALGHPRLDRVRMLGDYLVEDLARALCIPLLQHDPSKSGHRRSRQLGARDVELCSCLDCVANAEISASE